MEPAGQWRAATPVGLIPAAGFARRLGSGVSASKEVLPVGGVPVCVHLLRQLRRARVDQVVVVVRTGKWDVLEQLAPHAADLGLAVAYVVVDETPSAVHTLTAALPFVGDRPVALGFPDILLQPTRAFADVTERLCTTGADAVLGLFPTDRCEKTDMVALDEHGVPTELVIKQADRGLRYTWSMARLVASFQPLSGAIRVGASGARGGH